MAGIGHNSGDAPPHPDTLNGTAQNQIRSIIERVENLEAERAEINDHIKDVYAEAKGNGFDVAILRKVVRIRKQDAAKRAEEEAITDLYLSATGDLPGFVPMREVVQALAPELADEDGPVCPVCKNGVCTAAPGCYDGADDGSDLA